MRNKELRDSLLAVEVDDGKEKITGLETEKAALETKISELESQARTVERTLNERQSKIDSLERTTVDNQEEIKRTKSEGESRVKEAQAKLQESEILVTSLKKVIEDKASAATENDAQLQAKNAEIEMLTAQVTRLTNDLENDRRELGIQVQELRTAGQETIALYEERISQYEDQRYQYEETLNSLQEQLKAAAREPAPGELAKQASTALQIDNEMLREQVTHLNERILHLQDQLEEIHATNEAETEAIKTRIQRYKDRDAQQKKDLEASQIQLETVMKSEAAARNRIEELEEALRENASTLEIARAEVEGLRSDMTNLEGLNAGTNSKGLEEKLEDAARRATNDRNRYTEEIQQLKDSLEAAKTAKRIASEELAAVRLEAETTARRLELLEAANESIEQEKAELEKTLQRLQSRESDLRKSTRDSSNATTARSSKDDNYKEQVAGLKHIVQELQKENSGHVSKIKSLESEIKLLSTQNDELRKDVKDLEEAVEESLRREEASLGSETSHAEQNGDVASLQKALRENQVKSDAEMERLRKKLSDSEQRSAKTIQDLTKDVHDLEQLVEAKIYNEDHLERQIEALEHKITKLQAKRQPKASTEDTPIEPPKLDVPAVSEDVCPICEQSGHDVFTCPLLKDEDNAGKQATGTEGGKAGLYCEDCNVTGHTVDNCPQAFEVF